MTSLFFNDRRLRAGWRVLLFLGLSVLVTVFLGFPLIGLLAVSYFMTRFVDRRPFASLGLAAGFPAVRELLGGMALGAGLMGLFVGAMASIGGVQFQAGNLNLTPQTAWTLLGVLLSHLSIAAMEELLVRGYAFQSLVEGIGSLPTLCVTSTAFALMHYDNPGLTGLALVNLGLAGALLGALYLRTKSLWAPIGLHISWNAVQSTVLGLPVSGLVLEDHWLSLELRGPQVLSGGAFGPEGSLITTLILMGAAAFVLFSGRVRASPNAQRLWAAHILPREEAGVASPTA